jgi:hypothetical protein
MLILKVRWKDHVQSIKCSPYLHKPTKLLQAVTQDRLTGRLDLPVEWIGYFHVQLHLNAGMLVRLTRVAWDRMEGHVLLLNPRGHACLLHDRSRYSLQLRGVHRLPDRVPHQLHLLLGTEDRLGRRAYYPCNFTSQRASHRTVGRVSYDVAGAIRRS